MKNYYFAYCYRDGRIGFSKTVKAIPHGAIAFAKGEGKTFKDQVKIKCRLSYCGQFILCCGLPENDLVKFANWHKWAFPTQVEFLKNFQGAV